MARGAAAKAVAPLPPGHLRVCGDHVLRSADFEEDRAVDTLRRAGGAQALQRFADGLDDSDFARAVALVLRMEAKRLDSGAAASAASCRTGECFDAHAKQEVPLLQTELDRLAALALQSRDARVLTLARSERARRIGRGAGAASCERLTVRAWIERDRDNAAPWLALAAEEPTAREEALFQVARAKTIDTHHGAAWTFLGRVDRKSGPSALAVVGTIEHLGGLASTLSYATILEECKDRGLQDANRRQRCEALARLFTERGRTLMDLAIGARLAERLDWPEVAAIRGEQRALQQVAIEMTAATDAQAAMANCQIGLEPKLAADFARDGELQVLRDRLRASGRDVTQWAARASEADIARDHAFKRERASEEAASAASAAR